MGIYSNKEIIDGIRRKDRKMIEYLYDNYYPALRRMVLHNSGRDDDAWDIFQDTILIIFEKIRNDELQLKCAFSTYLYAIWKNKWLKTLERRRFEYHKNRSYDFQLVEENQESIEVNTDKEEQYLLVREYVEKLDERCRKIMKLHLKDYSNQEICDLLNISQYDLVRKKKHRCKEKLLQWIKSDKRYQAIMKNKKK
ncbi:MAG: sigma-70 family RNA polymerase sigma factor [Bacteroidales bacterium]|nr:sigma-70 family RNA polymerase sigma factor [Bacteroidales bacterium]MCF8386868.1 sigma-70 family RNA polymerase sigma factor [Bacteroidales bacterium]MCF8396555.1 sigma-70 family RNA polymerase sigma factor [Bacteroidales bacterium]